METPLMAETRQNLTPIEQNNLNRTTVLTTARVNNTLALDGTTTFEYRTCGHPKGWPHPCSPSYDPEATKCMGHGFDTVTFDRFTFYDMLDADCLDPTIDLNEATLETVNAGAAWAVAQELESAPWSGSPSLQSVATLVNPAGSLSPAGALALGFQFASATGFGPGSIVVPMAALPALDRHLSYQNGRLVGPGRTPIITGPGFTGNNLSNVPVSGEVTIYFLASAVEYRLSTPEWLGTNGALKAHRWNQSSQEAIRRGKLRFSPACIYAVRMCLVDETCCAPVVEEPPVVIDGGGVKRVLDGGFPVSGYSGLADFESAVKTETTKKVATAPEVTVPTTDTETAERQAVVPQVDVTEAPTDERTNVSRETLTAKFVGDSTIPQIKAAVGDDPDLAAQVIDLEQSTNDPRTTLIAAMQDLTETDTQNG